MQFTVEHRTSGLVWSERLGCFLATGVVCIPLFLWCRWMLPVLSQEQGGFLLVLWLAMVLGILISIVMGLGLSILIWWLPRLSYLALNKQAYRMAVQTGVRSRGIWIAGIGWLSWSGLHIYEKNGRLGIHDHCTSLVIKAPQCDDLVLRSSEHIGALLSQIRQFIQDQPTEFVNSDFPRTEILPLRPPEKSHFQPSRRTLEARPVSISKPKPSSVQLKRTQNPPQAQFEPTEILAEPNSVNTS